MSGVSWVPRTGEEFAGYHLISLIGHGGMSIVYQAEHRSLGRIVALKILSPEMSESSDFRERFQRESRVAASLEHPNIIPIYEAGEENGVLFIAMRYVAGADLRAQLKRDGAFDRDKAISLISQVAAALEAAHGQNLIHRDVKPANILVAAAAGPRGSDHFYLSDFGVTKNTVSPGLTRTGFFVGTADYAAPEQIEGKQLDARADVYALGCVAYEALTATPAFEKDSEVSMMYAHLLEAPPKVSEKRPDIGPEVDYVIARAMAKSIDDRFSRPTEFALALEHALAAAPPPQAAGATVSAGETVLASQPAVPAPAPAPVSAASAESPTPSAESPRVSGSDGGSGGGKGIPARGILAAAALAAVAGVAVLLVVLLGGDSGNPDATSTTSVPATTTATVPAGGNETLASVLMPTQISRECKAQAQPAAGAVETEVCVPPATGLVSDPDQLQFSFYSGSQPLLEEYRRLLTEAHGGAGQNKPLAKCGTNPAGQKTWMHPTGMVGGRRFCFTDAKGNYTIVWTHEKRGSEDHVDMLGTAREPGRSPTIYASWWASAKNFIGKCRPQVGQQLCLDTIEKATGKR
jgi:serine/threonine protein kinase